MHIVCEHCTTTNNIPEEKLGNDPKCGKCKKPLMTGNVIDLNNDNIYAHTNRNHIPTVVDFWAPWCGPCQQFAPTYAAVAKEKQQQFRFARVDTEAEQMIGSQFNIRSIPTLMVIKEGKIVAQISGALPKSQFEQWLAQAV